MFYVAKLIQLAGFAAVTNALIIGILEEGALLKELLVMAFGAALFYAGRMLERRAAA